MKNKFVLLISLFSLTACGTKIGKLGNTNLDHSSRWMDNYYTHYDYDLMRLERDVIELDRVNNLVFTSFTDENFIAQEERATGENALSYYEDFDNTVGYGPVMKLSHYNDYVREGFTSKLFDGQMFCHGYYEAARIQISEVGFSAEFGKTLVSSDYLYLQFKSALDFKSQKIEGHYDDITIGITFYSNEKGITYTYSLKDVPTNMGESYIFYGFSTKDLDLNNATRFAFYYSLDSDEYAEEKGTTIDHALLLYEFGFKNPVFK